MDTQLNSVSRRKRWLLSILLFIQGTSLSFAQSITIHNARINAAPPGSQVTSAYFEIDNPGAEAAIINRITSPDYHKIEIHRSILTDGVASMTLQEQLVIPGKKKFIFKPGDYHLMLYRNSAPLKAGESSTLTLHLSNGQQIPVMAKVTRPGQQPQHHH